MKDCGALEGAGDLHVSSNDVLVAGAHAEAAGGNGLGSRVERARNGARTEGRVGRARGRQRAGARLRAHTPMRAQLHALCAFCNYVFHPFTQTRCMVKSRQCNVAHQGERDRFPDILSHCGQCPDAALCHCTSQDPPVSQRRQSAGAQGWHCCRLARLPGCCRRCRRETTGRTGRKRRRARARTAACGGGRPGQWMPFARGPAASAHAHTLA